MPDCVSCHRSHMGNKTLCVDCLLMEAEATHPEEGSE